MNNTGALIPLHEHENFNTLKQINDVDGMLYYKDKPISSTPSKKSNNAIILEEDGLYVSNLTMLNFDQYNLISRFTYKNGALFFDDVIVPQEYTKSQITMMITDLWNDLEQYFDTGGNTNDITES